MTVDHASAADLLEAVQARLGDVRRRCLDRPVHRRRRVPRDPFEPPMVGHNALRAYLLKLAESQDQVEVTMERHWAVGATVLAAWHASYVAGADASASPGRGVHDDGDRGGRPHQPIPRDGGSGARRRRPGSGGGSMAGDVSFDVVSDFDEQELRNALDQVRREVGQRYDFKGVTVDLTQAKDELVLVTDDEYRAAAVKDLIESKAIRRDLSLKIFDWGKVEPCRRQQGPPGDQATPRPDGRDRQADHQAHPRRVPQGRSRRSRATRCASRARARTSCRRSSPACASSTSPFPSSSRTTAEGRRCCPEPASHDIVMIIVIVVIVVGARPVDLHVPARVRMTDDIAPARRRGRADADGSCAARARRPAGRA